MDQVYLYQTWLIIIIIDFKWTYYLVVIVNHIVYMCVCVHMCVCIYVCMCLCVCAVLYAHSLYICIHFFTCKF